MFHLFKKMASKLGERLCRAVMDDNKELLANVPNVFKPYLIHLALILGRQEIITAISNGDISGCLRRFFPHFLRFYISSDRYNFTIRKFIDNAGSTIGDTRYGHKEHHDCYRYLLEQIKYQWNFDSVSFAQLINFASHEVNSTRGVVIMDYLLEKCPDLLWYFTNDNLRCHSYLDSSRCWIYREMLLLSRVRDFSATDNLFTRVIQIVLNQTEILQISG